MFDKKYFRSPSLTILSISDNFWLGMDVVRKVEQVATDKENDEPVETVSYDKFVYSRSRLDLR